MRTYVRTYLPTYLHTHIHRYITLHYFTFTFAPTFTLHYITLHYIKNTRIHTYIHTYTNGHTNITNIAYTHTHTYTPSPTSQTPHHHRPQGGRGGTIRSKTGHPSPTSQTPHHHRGSHKKQDWTPIPIGGRLADAEPHISRRRYSILCQPCTWLVYSSPMNYLCTLVGAKFLLVFQALGRTQRNRQHYHANIAWTNVN